MGPLPELLQAHFQSPRNVGRMAPPACVGRAENAACGDLIELYARIEDGRLAEVSFQARGCSALIATASLASEALRGRSVDEAAGFDLEALVAGAGGLPPQRSHAPRVVARALAEALARAQAPWHP
ncbi:MAG TPA: iron-sulfur cluster assembly scaffold protein [Planctomycetota bacterium]|nr:iron-sulfur cluster assembly scaffold protein [Planctomycetota bacterium]